VSTNTLFRGALVPLVVSLTVGCAAKVPGLEHDLAATQTALQAQMDQAENQEGREAQLEEALAKAEDQARARAEAMAELDAVQTAEHAEDFVLDETSVVEQAAEQVSEDDLEALAVAEVAQGEAVLAPEALLAQVTGEGYGFGYGAGDPRLVAAIDNLARAVDEQRIVTTLEARLEDKQRLIDQLHGLSPGSGVASAVDPALKAQLDQQGAALAKLLEEEAADEEAALTAEEDAARLADEEALAAKEAAEAARWEALMQRLDALEGGGAAASVETADTIEQAVQQDPAVAALQAELAELRAERDEDAREEAWRREYEAGSAQKDRDARIDELVTTQQQALGQQQAALEQAEARRIEERKWWERMFSDMQLGAQQAAPASTTTVVAAPEDTRTDEILAAIRDLQEADAAAPDDEDAAVYEARIAELGATQAELEAERDRLEAERAQLEADLVAVQAQPKPDRKKEEELERLRSELAQLSGQEAEMAELQTQLDAMEAAEAAREAYVAETMQPLLDAGLKVEIHGDRARVYLPSDVLFGSGSSKLSAPGQATVKRVASVMAPLGVDVQVEGHTDNVPMSGSKTNWDLAYERARSVLQTLASGGVQEHLLSAASFGESRPVADNSTPEGRSANRRIEITVRLELD